MVVSHYRRDIRRYRELLEIFLCVISSLSSTCHEAFYSRTQRREQIPALRHVVM